MINVHTIVAGMLSENCYLCYSSDSTSCFVVDPGCDADTVLQAAEGLHKTVDAVFLTHGHFDHMIGAQGLKAKGLPIYLNGQDRDMPRHLSKDLRPEILTYGEGDVFHCGGTQITVMETPGHSKGSVCLLCGDVLFSGDTLFQGACGRTDFHGGSRTQMQASLRRLMELPDRVRVYPGHGESTTVGAEKQHNPYCR